MTGVVFERALAHGLCVGFSVTGPLPAASAWQGSDDLVHPAEKAFAEEWAPPRACAWLAGRSALRVALARQGFDVPGPILSTPRGAPDLPRSIAASISHKATPEGLVAVALVGSPGSGPVGVDLELLAPTRASLDGGILSPAEAEALREAPPSARWQAVLTRFCLKEAAFKALDSVLPCRLDLREVSAWPLPTGAATLDWPASYDLAPGRLEARWLFASPYLLATARLRGGAPVPA